MTEGTYWTFQVGAGFGAAFVLLLTFGEHKPAPDVRLAVASAAHAVTLAELSEAINSVSTLRGRLSACGYQVLTEKSHVKWYEGREAHYIKTIRDMAAYMHNVAPIETGATLRPTKR